jgi:dipeptidyl aminopeptidase/acylaminoacyl peptidase
LTFALTCAVSPRNLGQELAMRRTVKLGAGLLAALALTSSAVAQAPAKAPWPYSDDIPKPAPAPAGLAGDPRPSLARFLLASGPGSASISPKGDLVSYLDNLTGVAQLWVVPASGGAPKQITFGLGVRDYSWSPDGRLLVASDLNGDEREGYTLLSADGRKETVATPRSDAFLSFGGFSPDGKRYAYSSTARNGIDFDVYAGDVATGAQKLAYQGKFGFLAHAWRPGSSDVLVGETRGEDANDLHLVNVETGKLTTLFKPDVAAAYRNLAWSPDGKTLYMVTNEAGEFAQLMAYDLTAKKKTVIDSPNADVDDFALYNDGKSLAWTVNRGGYSDLYIQSKTFSAKGPQNGLPKGVYGIVGSDHLDRLVVNVRGPTTPGEIWIIEPGKKAKLVAPRDGGLAIDTFAAPLSVDFPAQDGVKLNGLLYLPPGVSKPPVVIQVHGGPTSQARPGFSPFIQYLVSHGVAVFDLNFRGSTGFGKTFTRLDNKRLRPNAVRDIGDTLDFLGKDGRVDASKAAIMGGSYGGYMTNAAVGAFPGRFKAAVSIVGVSDWVRALEEAGPALKASDRLEYGDITNADDRAFFNDLSPMKNIDKSKTPMIVLHGANDPRDPVTESDRLVEAVRKNGVEVKYLRFPDEGHGFRKLANNLFAYEQIAAFLDAHLK